MLVTEKKYDCTQKIIALEGKTRGEKMTRSKSNLDVIFFCFLGRNERLFHHDVARIHWLSVDLLLSKRDTTTRLWEKYLRLHSEKF